MDMTKRGRKVKRRIVGIMLSLKVVLVGLNLKTGESNLEGKQTEGMIGFILL